MKSTIRILFIILVFWIIGCAFFYICVVKDHCKKNNSEATIQTQVVDQKEAQTEEQLEETKVPDPTISPSHMVYFAFASTEPEIADADETYINELLAYLAHFKAHKVLLTGHSDNRGSTAANQHFSQVRAQSVRDLLLTKGIGENQINIEAKGDTEPLASNENPEGRNKNRRVELKIIK